MRTVFAVALMGEDCTVWADGIKVFTTIYLYDREIEAIDIGPGRFFVDIGLGAAGQDEQGEDGEEFHGIHGIGFGWSRFHLFGLFVDS